MDVIMMCGGFDDGQFQRIGDEVWCSDSVCSWWGSVFERREALNTRIQQLEEVHGRPAVRDCINQSQCANVAFSDIPEVAHAALDERFGKAQDDSLLYPKNS